MWKNTDFNITEDDRLWVEENFRWLITVFGYPNRQQAQIAFNPTFFPKTTAGDPHDIQNIIDDLAFTLALDSSIVTYEVVPDLRASSNFPLLSEGHQSFCDTDLKKGDHRITISEVVLKDSNRLIATLIPEFVKIRLVESEIEFDAGGDDTQLFIYLAAIYYGFGVILASSLTDTGRKTNGMWEIKWSYASEMPMIVFMFSLAVYAKLRGEDNPDWKDQLPGEQKKTFEKAINFLKENPGDLINEKEIQANDLFNQANDQFEHNDLDGAISTLQKILFITNDDHMKADVFNNMGYYYSRKGNYNMAISSFRKALALGPEYGYANDNLGYALIVSGELEEGRSYLEKAIETENNDRAYTFRNFALYYEKKNDFNQARTFYQKAFAENTPVDLLEYHYAQFLLKVGEKEKAIDYLNQSIAKNEHEGAELLKSLQP